MKGCSPLLCRVISAWALVAILFVIVLTSTRSKTASDRLHPTPFQPFDIGNGSFPVPEDDYSLEIPEYNSSQVDEDIFAEKGTNVQKFQTDECLVTADPCEAFSSQCCPGLICVPVNELESRCSHFKGSICLDTGALCNDAVYGVDCCDDGICTPVPGTDQSRCVLPTAVSASTQQTAARTNDESTMKPTSRRLLRHLG